MYVYTTGKVTMKGMLIPDNLITDEIQDTQVYKDYEKEFVGQKPISTTLILPPSDNRERDEIHEATLLSLALHKTTKIVEEQENVASIKEEIFEEDVEKLIEGEDKESYASEFVDSVYLDEEDSGTRLDPESHKENPCRIYDISYLTIK
ncbi:hypothetical protein Tco_1080508 [Tanacetum coccineum]|uniref:Uncharacterized protein n=1 Tax=Tanacetum coccineum TaxID=301880 RepID=A0ABQ5HUX0_9ASTR